MPREYVPVPVQRLALTVPEIAKSLGIGTSSVYRLAREGELTLTRVGGRTLGMIEDVNALLEAGKKAAGSQKAKTALDARVALRAARGKAA